MKGLLSARVASEAEGYVAHWQGVLGLQNWRVEVTAKEQPLSNATAVTSWPANYRSAEIAINLSSEDKHLGGENLNL